MARKIPNKLNIFREQSHLHSDMVIGARARTPADPKLPVKVLVASGFMKALQILKLGRKMEGPLRTRAGSWLLVSSSSVRVYAFFLNTVRSNVAKCSTRASLLSPKLVGC